MSKDNEYRVATEIQTAFRGPGEFPLTRPLKYYLDTARNPVYTKGCSMFFVTDQETWLTLTPSQRQDIFERRHIVIEGLTLDGKQEFDADAFARMGVPTNRAIEVHGAAIDPTLTCDFADLYALDLSKRTAHHPQDGIGFTTPLQLMVQAADEVHGKVLNAMDLPMHLTTLPDPLGFEYVPVHTI